MAKYFLDTEFLEGKQKTFFGKTKETIDLISIGLVAEDGREYYAVSKDFNLKEAWHRFEWKRRKVSDGIAGPYKQYWIRDNVLMPIFYELALQDFHNIHYKDEWYYNGKEVTYNNFLSHPLWKGDYKWFKKLIIKYGVSNEQIADEIFSFVNPCSGEKTLNDPSWNRHLNKYRVVATENKPIEFYGYYADYDWVVFCWLFGNMVSLPDGFPMYCRDLKQIMDEKFALTPNDPVWKSMDEKLAEVKKRTDYPKQTNEHSAIHDARWNKQLYQFLKTI